MDVDSKEPAPALFDQCLEVYVAMTEDAVMKEIAEDQNGLVYTGFLTKLITRDLHFSNPYYTKITGRLKAMDCIRQLKRGGSTSPSVWLLMQEPTLEQFNEAKTKSTTRPAGWRESMEQQIRAINERLNRAGI